MGPGMVGWVEFGCLCPNFVVETLIYTAFVSVRPATNVLHILVSTVALT